MAGWLAGGKGALLPNRRFVGILRLLGPDRLPINQGPWPKNQAADVDSVWSM